MYKNPLVILGKAPVKGKLGKYAHDDWPVHEVWTVGTADIKDADRYYEFHGIERYGRVMCTKVSPRALEFGRALVPLNNSVCLMLMEAFVEGYTDITVAGCPMSMKEEYVAQKPALAMCVGFIRGIGYARLYTGEGNRITVRWLEEPAHGNYYEEHRK